MRVFTNLSIILIVFFVSLSCLASDKDFQKVFELIKQKKWSESHKYASKTKDKTLDKIVSSQQFLDTKCTDNNFEKIAKFLEENPNWPQNYSLKLRAESLIGTETDKKSIVKWFSKNTPVTGKGYKYYALAAVSVMQNSEKLPTIIKAGWHYGCFSQESQEVYYKKFRKYLTSDDHIKKIDNHLWNKEITAAKNNLKLVNNDYKKSFKAQIALMQQNKNALSLFKQVPKKYYTPGLVYQYLNARKKDLPTGTQIAELSRIASIDKHNADKFWKIQVYLAREFIEKKKYRDAYKASNSCFSSNVVSKSDSEYLSGWLALIYLKKADLALKHFRNFNRIVKTPISKSRGIYWLARAHELNKDFEKAKKLYYLGATRYPYTFYGQLSSLELGHKNIILPDIISITGQDQDINLYIKNNEIARAAQIVSKYGSNLLSQIYITAAIEQAKNTSDIHNVIGALDQIKNIHHTTWAAKRAMQKHVFIKNYAFPIPYKFGDLPVEHSLTYSLIRQESVFDQFAISSANAMGLMQLIKPTACDTAKLINTNCRISKLTTDTNYNILLGSNYISKMINDYDGSYILAIASYNGGPHNVDKWLKIYGDPRTMKNHREVLNWLEHIPFYETRNYVQRVLENLQIYRHVLENNDKFRLLDDLLHKNGKNKNDRIKNRK